MLTRSMPSVRVIVNNSTLLAVQQILALYKGQWAQMWLSLVDVSFVQH